MNQQETERLHVEEFLRRSRIQGTVEYGDAPDAVVTIDGRQVGIEHCELTEQDLASNKPNIDSLEPTLKEELKKLPLAGDLHVGIGVDAHASHYFRKRSTVRELAVRLARFAHEHEANVTSDARLDFNIPELERLGFPGLRTLILSRVRIPGGPHVTVTPGYWGPVESSVVAAIEKKEQRLPAYKEKKTLAECWLLLVTGESWTQATDSALTEWLRIDSDFDAVFLMDTRTGQVQRLDERAGG